MDTENQENSKKKHKEIKTKKNNKVSPKKKLKVKVKAEEKSTTKVKKVVSSDKPIDERTIDVAFEEKVKEPDENKPEQTETRDERFNYMTGVGTQHPVHEMIQNLRNILIQSGFNELENSFFVSESDILKQSNLNSNLIFDRTYNLAERQRPTLEINQNIFRELDDFKHFNDTEEEELKQIIDDYNQNLINHSQLFLRLMDELGLSSKEVIRLLELFPLTSEELKKTTGITLRSNIGSSWFNTLTAIMNKEHLPIKVFSTGVWFKREPKLDEVSLRSHYGASCIIMDQNIKVNNGRVIAEEILNRLGFEELEFRDNDQSQTFTMIYKEVEILKDDIKIGTCGKFSKKILKKYGIDIPVLYINFGIEHMVMVKNGIDDIRQLMYPQFYKAWKLNDQEIGEAIQFVQSPKTEIGKEIAANIVKTCEQNSNVPSPCEFTVWKGPVNIKIDGPKINGDKSMNEQINDLKNYFGMDGQDNSMEKYLTIKVVKKEKDSKLCGPAFLNEIVVKNGEIYGVQNLDQNQEFNDAFRTNIRYLDAFSNYVANTIEQNLVEGTLQDHAEFSAKIIRDMEDINLQLDSRAVRYLLTNNKKIDVKGPMFVNVEYSLQNLKDDNQSQEDTIKSKVNNSPKKDKDTNNVKAKIESKN